MRNPLSVHANVIRFAAILALSVTETYAVSPQSGTTSPPLTWNVFLGPWQVLGPFPKPSSENGSGVLTAYLQDEPNAKPGGTISYQGRSYSWKPYAGRVLDFQRAFGATNDLEQVVAYAWTSFHSDRDQDAVLALGSDDGARVWLNGKLVIDHPNIRACYLDDDRIPVRLRKGENALLVKVENFMKDWGAVARLLPPRLEQPLLTFEWGSTAGIGFYNLFEVPDVGVEFLNGDNRVISKHQVSGFRVLDGNKVLFRLYAEPPKPEPASVRIEFSHSGYSPLTQTVAWATALASAVPVKATGNCQLTGRVLDAESGQPISGAKIRMDGSPSRAQSESDGRFHLQGLEPLISRMTVKAPGHTTAVQSVHLPPSGPVEVRLTAGGPEVRGRVVLARTGEPAEGVTIALVSEQDRVRADVSRYWADMDFSGADTESEADGSFSLTKPEPGMDLLLIKRDAGFLYIADAQSLVQNGVMELPFPEPATLRGRTLLHGEPVPNEKLNIQWLPPGDKQAWQVPFQFGGNLQADAHGRFEIKGLGPGQYQLSRVKESTAAVGAVPIPDYTDSRNLVLLPGQVLEADIDRAPGFVLSGRTLDTAGKPLSNCVVRAYDGQTGGGIDQVRSDSEGNFRIADVPDGLLGVMAQHYHLTGPGNVWYADASANRMISVAGPTNLDLRFRPVRQSQASAARQGLGLLGAIPPDFTASFVNTNGTLTLSDQLGKVVAMDFWATWCGPCMMQVPEVKRVWEKYRHNPDVVFVSVSLDSDTNELRRVMEKKGLDFPVIWSGNEVTNGVSDTFGVNAIPTSFVIGRNGRFRSEPSHGGGLDGLIESALAEPPDPALMGATNSARLYITVAFAQDSNSVPGTVMNLEAIDASGKSLKSEKLPMPGRATRLRWLYPPVGPEGKIRVSVNAPDLPAQTREIIGPRHSDQVVFRFDYPRTIRGRLVVDGSSEPARGLKVNASGLDGPSQCSTISDGAGRFAIPVLPGTYSLSVEGNDQIAPPPRWPFSDRISVEVAKDADPPEQEIVLTCAVTVQGRTVDASGKPVPDAKVSVPGIGEPVTTDSAGRFRLPGVPAKGPVRLVAYGDRLLGHLQLVAADTNEVYTIRISDQIQGGRALTEGETIPDLKLKPLAGEPFLWHPAQDGNTLLVFCTLWHPQGHKMLEDAVKQAGDQKIHLVLCSTDLTFEQAVRQLHSSPTSTQVYYAGDDTSVQDTWRIGGPAQAYLIGGDGKVLQAPAPGTLPKLERQ